MEKFNLLVGTNIAKYRKMHDMTQLELAEMINFSDKSVSKWERGEGIPDVEVLKNICDIFGVTLNDMVVENSELKVSEPVESHHNRWLISLISAGGVWVIATILFVALLLIGEGQDAWRCFVYAVPFCFVVLLVFACMWGSKWSIFTLITVVLWTTLMVICMITGKWIIIYIGIPLQVVELLVFTLKFPTKRRHPATQLQTVEQDKIQE